MKPINRLIVLIPLLFQLNAEAWNLRPAFNKPRSVTVTSNGTSPIPTRFALSQKDNTQSLVLNGLANQGYNHVCVTNETKEPLSWITAADGTAAPANTVSYGAVSQKQFVASSGNGCWDDISIFDNFYLMSEGSSPLEGKVKISVW